MGHKQQIDTEFSARFFSQIEQHYPSSTRQYRCTEISDIHYCQLGVLRCLSGATTGQQFLQLHADQGLADIDPGYFFKVLKSQRRLAIIPPDRHMRSLSAMVFHTDLVATWWGLQCISIAQRPRPLR